MKSHEALRIRIGAIGLVASLSIALGISSCASTPSGTTENVRSDNSESSTVESSQSDGADCVAYEETLNFQPFNTVLIDPNSVIIPGGVELPEPADCAYFVEMAETASGDQIVAYWFDKDEEWIAESLVIFQDAGFFPIGEVSWSEDGGTVLNEEIMESFNYSLYGSDAWLTLFVPR